MVWTLRQFGTPAGVALVDGDPTVVTAFVAPFAASLGQQRVHLHGAVDPFDIGRCAGVLFCLTAQQGMDAAVAVGWQISDE